VACERHVYDLHFLHLGKLTKITGSNSDVPVGGQLTGIEHHIDHFGASDLLDDVNYSYSLGINLVGQFVELVHYEYCGRDNLFDNLTSANDYQKSLVANSCYHYCCISDLLYMDYTITF